MAMLPCSIAIMVLMYLADAAFSLASAAGLLIALLTTLALRWVSNALQLIRVRSWAVSSAFALLIGATAPLHGWAPWAMVLCLLHLVHLSGLFYSAVLARGQVGVLVSSAALALMSMLEPLTLWLLVPMLVTMLLCLRVMNGRTFAAVFFGLLLPYEFWLAWILCSGGVDALVAMLQECSVADLLLPKVGNWQAVLDIFATGLGHKAAVTAVGEGALLVLSLFAIVHFLKTSIDDKIVVRMFYITVLMEWVVLTALLLVGMPQSVGLIPCLALCSAPLWGRYLVFARGWTAAVVSWLMMLTLLFLWLCPYLFSA